MEPHGLIEEVGCLSCEYLQHQVLCDLLVDLIFVFDVHYKVQMTCTHYYNGFSKCSITFVLRMLGNY